MQNYSTESSIIEHYIPLDIYSHILALGAIVVAVASLFLILAYALSASWRRKISSLSYEKYMVSIWILSLTSTLAVLLYQYAYGLLVCELCWWQRIFMFPIEFVVFWSLMRKIRGNEAIIMSLSAFGIFFASYHYYLHFQSWVLKQAISTPCEMWGILPSCADPAGVVLWGFLTIPFMALLVFLSIFALAWLSGKAKK